MEKSHMRHQLLKELLNYILFNFRPRLVTLVTRLNFSEAKLSAQAKVHKAEVQELEKKLAEATENFNVELTKHEISAIEHARVQKNVEELRQAKEKCYNVATECAKNMKNNFSKVGTFSTEKNFICGDPDGVIRWINGEIEAFKEILSNRRDFCAFAGVRGAVSVLEKVGCNHAKVVVHPGFSLSADDIKTLRPTLLH
jgi:hypothetical protein